ncbi:unnamed protein product [Linum trigynum]|uniref:Secreted protein n=1 Tax=Linum trigynum TaxID=586398 RepID=A0AAV2DZV7_9ROSI
MVLLLLRFVLGHLVSFWKIWSTLWSSMNRISRRRSRPLFPLHSSPRGRDMVAAATPSVVAPAASSVAPHLRAALPLRGPLLIRPMLNIQGLQAHRPMTFPLMGRSHHPSAGPLSFVSSVNVPAI